MQIGGKPLWIWIGVGRIEQPQSSFVVPFQSATTSEANRVVGVQTVDGQIHTDGFVIPGRDCKWGPSDTTENGLKWTPD